MLKFLGNFSDSFLLALIAWPFVAALLSLPILLVQYIRFHRLPKGRVATLYLFILYALALVAFTLYPMPDDPTKFCADYHLSPQFNPLQFIFDIKQSGLRAVLQITMNIAFFVPLGLALRNLFGRKIVSLILIALVVSLFIEVAQLTGAFHIYPCSYRLFDVNDLMFNTFGALIGYWLGSALPNFSKPQKNQRPNAHPSGLHRLITFSADLILNGLLAVFLTLPIYFTGGDWQAWQPIIYIGCLIALQFLVPLLWRGQTIFGKLTGISLDDKNRSPVWRISFYLTRLALIALAIIPQNGWSALLCLTLVIYYLIARKLPYSLVDKLFEKKPKS
jgi:glycopeptide antibiotics resistance protein